MKAEIIKSSDGAMWMVINGDEDTAWAIEENEIKAIMKACKKYLDINKSKK
jgi:hypothetical protein